MSERSLYTSGKSQVLSVPPDWAALMNKKYRDKVFVRRYGEMLLILPSIDYSKYRKPSDFEVKGHDIMVQRLYSAYLVGTEELRLRVSPDDNVVDDRLGSLRDYLYGMSLVRQSDTEILVRFNPGSDSVTDLLEREFQLYQAMHRENLQQLKNYPRLADEAVAAKMESYERSLNATSFQARRALINAVYDPESYLSLELEHPGDILGYTKIERNLERLGDRQQKGIFPEITNLKIQHQRHRLVASLDQLRDYFSLTHDLVVTAYLESKNLQEGVFVIRSSQEPAGAGLAQTAYSEHATVVDWLTQTSVNIFRALNKRKADGPMLESVASTLKSLWHLEARIEGMVGAASNISEAWLNMLSRK